jgi:hypothetical protein
MNWIRSHLRFAARLALFTLCLQLALSFGHVHRGGIVLVSAGAAVAVAAHDPLPADGTVGDICAVCALIQLVNSSVPGTAPLFGLPTVTPSSRVDAAIENQATAPGRGIFRARAPPRV